MLALLVFGAFDVKVKKELFTGRSMSCGGFNKANEAAFSTYKLRLHIRECMALSRKRMKVRRRPTNSEYS